jgi:hypothetical protein
MFDVPEIRIQQSKILIIGPQITRFSSSLMARIMASSHREQGANRQMPLMASRFEQLDDPITKGAHDVERP